MFFFKSSNVTVRLDEARLHLFLEDVSRKSARAAATRLRDAARRKAPKRTGRGAESISVRSEESSWRGSYYLVGPEVKYMAYQESGTGPIHARPGGVLRFQSGGVFVFARRTRGVPAVHFMRDSYREMTVQDFRPDA
jgi:HK97 gp10 family phage protein